MGGGHGDVARAKVAVALVPYGGMAHVATSDTYLLRVRGPFLQFAHGSLGPKT